MYKIQPKTVFVGKEIKYLPSCQSTNDSIAKMCLETECGEGLCVITNGQTMGRGQRGNSWEAEAGKNLTASVLLKPNFLLATDQFYLNMAISLAIFEGVSLVISKNIKIKWPNDILFENKKLAGILIENTLLGNYLNTTIIGIGLNINQTKFENERAISIKNILQSNSDHSIEHIFESILEKLEERYFQLKNNQLSKIKTDYINNLFRFENWHLYKKNNKLFDGKINGVDNNGRLQIETEVGLQVFDFKEVEFIYL